ncbi:odorant receptor 10-like [Halictus rubicundus]|uniref:odorant receptor 10-like n=1 Tax=Halictus rubicundus TaxID=77578 RepID=UPI0040350BD4
MTIKRLTYVCKLMSIIGCWIPDSWTSPSKRILYCTYSALVWINLHVWSLSQILDLIINVKTQDEFTDNFFSTMAIACICMKMSNLLLKRRHLGNTINTIEKEPFSPLNIEEEEIRTKFDKLAKRNAVAFTLVISGYVLSTCAMALLTGYKRNRLLSRAWLPYEYSTFLSFTVTNVHQVVAQIYAGSITIANDSLFNGFLMHTYCHFEILKHRLKIIVADKKCTLKRCSYLHDHIYKYASTVNSQFRIIIMIQSIVTIATVCCTLYELTQKDLGSRFLEVTLYLVNTLVQIFYYCWYGNEIKLKSLDVSKSVFQCNWTSLDNDAKMFLVMMIRRARVPIEFSAIHVVSIDLEMFTTILKTSYSAYNLMQ